MGTTPPTHIKHTTPSRQSPPYHTTLSTSYAAPSPSNPILPPSEFDARGILGVAAWGVLAVRPAETFAASLLARRAHVPTSNYAKVLTYFVSYLLDHENDELVYSATGSTNDLTSFVDSSWGNCPETRRSWFGYAISWCGAVFSVRAKLQPCVALASRDAEAIAAVFAVKALLGFTIMLTELGFKTTLPTTLHVDNKATVDSAHSEKLSKESRFMAMRLLWLREMVQNSLVHIRHVATGDNHSDIFTKILPAQKHNAFRATLMGTAAPATLLALFGT